MYYSKTTGGFYATAINGGNIPPDAQRITDEEYAALMHGQTEGKRIVADETGRPVLQAITYTRAEVVAAKWDAIKAERDRRAQQGGYKVGADWFHSDTFSRTQQVGLVLYGANMPAGIKWKTMSGSFVGMNPQLAQQIFASAGAQDNATFQAAEAHRVAMEASLTPDAYDFSAGWPPVFEA
jgi:hypothetical protein